MNNLQEQLASVCKNADGNLKSLLNLLAQDDPMWLPIFNEDDPSIMTPQLQAYLSEADEIYFGGAAGGSKTDLIIGLSLTAHRQSIIYRREFPQLEGIVRRLEELTDPAFDSLRQSNNPSLLTRDKRLIRFGSVQHGPDVKKYKGRPFDGIFFDEITDFLKDQYTFLKTWNRTSIPGQRCQVLCAGNPPTDEQGEWVIDYWAPWLDDTHPDFPVKPGELRWFAMIEGKETLVDGPGALTDRGKIIYPKSRTFIPALVTDNPYYMKTGYDKVLMNLPENLRKKMYEGDFSRVSGENPWQVIPAGWVKLAMDRWTEKPPKYYDEDKKKKLSVPMSCVGADIARGGDDLFTIARRHDNWFDKLIVLPGKIVTDGAKGATFIMKYHKGNANINIDVIGVGSSVYDNLKDQLAGIVKVSGVNVAEKSRKRDKSRKFGFINKRAEYWWKFMEALDPDSGQDLALPPDRDLRVELVSAQYEITPRGIKVKSKEEVKKRIGRSTDRADAVILAFVDSGGVGMIT